MANNYKVKMVDLQNKYKFKIFCSSQMYDDTELKRQLDTIYKAFPKASGTGTSASLDGTAAAIMNIGLKGNGSQTGTPTPASPISVNVVSGDNTIDICGKNLFNANEVQIGKAWNNTSNNGRAVIIIPVEQNVPYTISMNGNNIMEDIYVSYSAKTLSENAINGVGLSQITTFPRVYTSSTNYIILQFNKSSVSLSDIENLKLQVEKGSTATTYEPYIGASYPINLGVKNLFDKSTANLNKGVATANGGLYNSDINFSTDYIEVKTNGTYYTASGVSSVANRVYGAQYDSNKQYVGAISTNVGQKTLYISNANVKYIRLTGLLEEIDTYQIEEGSKTNSYNPYGTTPIELCKIGDYQDYIYKEGKKWYKYNAIQKYDAWDTVSMSTTHTNTNTYQFLLPSPTTVSLRANVLSNYFQNQINNNDIEHLFIGTGSPSVYNGLNVFINNTTAADSSAAKTWLKNNGVVVYYVLETPTTEEITDSTLISQLEALRNAESYEGQTNISQTNNDLPFIITASAIKDLSNL